MKRPEGFQDADALAEFANLNPEDPKAVSYFRNNYPDFAPAAWWDYYTERFRVIHADDPDYPEFKGIERKGVEIKVSVSDTMGVINLWQATQETIQLVWQNQFKFASIFNLTELLKLVFVSPSSELIKVGDHIHMSDGEYAKWLNDTRYSFHQAILFLHRQPWRAKICDEKRKGCGKYFVANHPARDFCEYPDAEGETCRQKDDKRRKLEYYYATGKKKRQAKMRKGSPRLPGAQRKKAAAKT